MKDDWIQVPNAPQSYQMQTEFGIFMVQLSRGYPRSRTFVVKLRTKDGDEVVESFVRDGIEARKIAEAELRRLRAGRKISANIR